MPSIYYKFHRDYGPQTVEKDDKSGLKAAKSKQTYEWKNGKWFHFT